MEIRIDSLRERPRRLVFAEPVEAFPLLIDLIGEGRIAFQGQIEVDLVATLVGNLVEVEGSLHYTVVQECSRCLYPVAQHLELPVALSFSRQPHAEVGITVERELSEEEVGLIVFEGEELDLRSPLEQEVLMALPQHPLCLENCAGLCPVCGIDRNRNRCDCAAPVFHGSFAGLRNFKINRD